MLTDTVKLEANDPIFETSAESIHAIIRHAGGRLTAPTPRTSTNEHTITTPTP